MRRIYILSLTIALVPMSAQAYCFRDAAERYGIPSGLLTAIAQTESSMNPKAKSHTNDIGLMQINRSWVPILKSRFGITEDQLWNPCTNVMVGAWILANEFSRNGRNWNSVGAYNARCNKLKGFACAQVRQNYTMKVWRNWKR